MEGIEKIANNLLQAAEDPWRPWAACSDNTRGPARGAPARRAHEGSTVVSEQVGGVLSPLCGGGARGCQTTCSVRLKAKAAASRRHHRRGWSRWWGDTVSSDAWLSVSTEPPGRALEGVE